MRSRVILSCVFVVAACAVAGHAAATDVTPDQRLDAIRHAKLWSATNVGTMDIARGPQGSFAFRPGETVTCKFTPKPHGKGSTPKFECAQASGRALKVRYGNDNGEVY